MRRLAFVLAAGFLLAAICAAGASAAFPGRNGRIVFEKQGDQASPLYSVNPDGSGLRRITGHEYDSKPSAAPDGRTVTFSRDGAVFTVRMSGRHLSRLTPSGRSTEPSFSGPLGRRIAFTRFGQNTSKLWLMASDGTNDRRLTDPPTADRSPAFSPDGEWIAFTRLNQDHDERIYEIRSDGSGLRRLTDGKPPAGPPSFSPNGKSIIFDRMTKNGNWAIDVMRANGTHIRRVGLGEDPAFSPNGRRIVFVREANAHGHIYTMDRRGHHVRRITPRNWSAWDPDWAPRAEGG